METGHANHLRDDWSTTAYWYQTLPGPKLDILPVKDRLPAKPQIKQPDAPSPQNLTELQMANIKQRDERMEAFVEDRNKWLERRAIASRERAQNNVRIAKDIKKRFMESLKK
jgi:hypothetical protein